MKAATAALIFAVAATAQRMDVDPFEKAVDEVRRFSHLLNFTEREPHDVQLVMMDLVVMDAQPTHTADISVGVQILMSLLSQFNYRQHKYNFHDNHFIRFDQEKTHVILFRDSERRHLDAYLLLAGDFYYLCFEFVASEGGFVVHNGTIGLLRLDSVLRTLNAVIRSSETAYRANVLEGFFHLSILHVVNYFQLDPYLDLLCGTFVPFYYHGDPTGPLRNGVLIGYFDGDYNYAGHGGFQNYEFDNDEDLRKGCNIFFDNHMSPLVSYSDSSIEMLYDVTVVNTRYLLKNDELMWQRAKTFEEAFKLPKAVIYTHGNTSFALVRTILENGAFINYGALHNGTIKTPISNSDPFDVLSCSTTRSTHFVT